jgi:hypothetical protein
MVTESRKEFLKYLERIDISIYGEEFQAAVGLALSCDDSAWVEVPNWWPAGALRTASNHEIAKRLIESLDEQDGAVSEGISLTRDEKVYAPPSETRKRVLSTLLNEVVTTWSADPHGKNPVVKEADKNDPQYAVLAYPLPGDASNDIAQWIGLPPCYNGKIPRWQMLESGKPELVATITNTGHFTRPHVDNPYIQADVFHVFGRKLWFIWADSDSNTAAIQERQIKYDEIDIPWCLENLTGLQVSRLIDFCDHICPDIVMLMHSIS